jgi:hypothetical protein
MAEGTASQAEYISFLHASITVGPGGMLSHVAVWAVMVTTGQSETSPEGMALKVAASAAHALGPDEPAEQCRLLRDLMGNPIRPPPAIDPTWLTWNNGTVKRLAQAAYEHRQLPSGHLDPARLSVLADALLDAVCALAELLDHLRDPGPHVRGCHVIDLLTGRE